MRCLIQRAPCCWGSTNLRSYTTDSHEIYAKAKYIQVGKEVVSSECSVSKFHKSQQSSHDVTTWVIIRWPVLSTPTEATGNNWWPPKRSPPRRGQPASPSRNVPPTWPNQGECLTIWKIALIKYWNTEWNSIVRRYIYIIYKSMWVPIFMVKIWKLLHWILRGTMLKHTQQNCEASFIQPATSASVARTVSGSMLLVIGISRSRPQTKDLAMWVSEFICNKSKWKQVSVETSGAFM